MKMLRMQRQATCLLLVFLMGTVFPGGPSGAVEGPKTAHPEMLSHRAIYKISLAGPNRNKGQLSEVSGRMVTEWQQTCDGVIAEQRIVTDMLDEAGDKSVSDISASSWESLDGLRFRFSMRQRLDNELMAEYDGTATLDAARGPGVAAIRKPEEKSLKLPAGIQFPSAYMQSLIEAARAGQKRLAGQVFDGTSESDYYEVVTAIGSGTTSAAAEQTEVANQPPGAHKSVKAAVAGLTWWPVQVSYYALNNNEGLPEFEMAFRLYDNGVSTDLTLDYGAFALFVALQRIDTYKAPDC